MTARLPDYNAVVVFFDPQLGPDPFSSEEYALDSTAIAMIGTFFGTGRQGEYLRVGEYGGIFGGLGPEVAGRESMPKPH